MKFGKQLVVAGIFLATVILISVFTIKSRIPEISKAQKIKSSFSPKSEKTSAKGRETYLFNMLKDPVTNQIPAGIRAQELELYNELPKSQLKSATYIWNEAGPNNVGGRTRAIAIDVRNSNILLAGGVSGGVWKSTDKGQTWELKNSPDESFSVTSICQDPRSGYQDTWYYAGGEFNGSSASAKGASYSGHGLYKSTDNGETWDIILGGEGTSQYKWDALTDYVSKIQVDPSSGYLYLAVHSYGLIKVHKEDGNYKMFAALGGGNDHYYCDFDIDVAGNKLVVLSEYGSDSGDDRTNIPGVYYEASGSNTFTQIDAASTTFPANYDRSVIRFAPSNSNIGYVFTNIDEDNVAFHKINISANQLIDRTDNLPSYNDETGRLGPQGNYNITLAVKPDDENFVVIGNTSLFRSLDGFATSSTNTNNWIGGYESGGTFKSYTNHHADCHISVFDPKDTDALWSGHDGGISYSSDIDVDGAVSWEKKNNGYNVTQFYTLSNILDEDERYAGGAQDNGTPFFTYNETLSNAKNIGTGDGSYCYFAKNFSYTSAQRGSITRTKYNAEGVPYSSTNDSPAYSQWTRVNPDDAEGQLFINPFAINPNNENVMYYPAGEKMWINKTIEDIPNYQNKTMEGWSSPSALNVTGYAITALSVSKSPADVLYYGAYLSTDKPKIYKVENSTADESSLVRTDVSIPAADSGSYPYCIAINPQDADEIIVIFSNYNVKSIFHSTDGGLNYSQIDGNLTSSDEVRGPSIRSASIHNWDGTKTYYISTSIGVYKTQNLDGSSTIWENVASNLLGNVVCNVVKTNDADGRVVVASHGRGIFVGKPTITTTIEEAKYNFNKEDFEIYPNPTNGLFKIRLENENLATYKVEIYSNSGRAAVVKEFESLEQLTTHEFNLSNFAKGVYFVVVQTSNRKLTKKILVQ